MRLSEYIKQVLEECEPGTIEFDVGILSGTYGSLGNPDQIKIGESSTNRIRFTVNKPKYSPKP